MCICRRFVQTIVANIICEHSVWTSIRWGQQMCIVWIWNYYCLYNHASNLFWTIHGDARQCLLKHCVHSIFIYGDDKTLCLWFGKCIVCAVGLVVWMVKTLCLARASVHDVTVNCNVWYSFTSFQFPNENWFCQLHRANRCAASYLSSEPNGNGT